MAAARLLFLAALGPAGLGGLPKVDAEPAEASLCTEQLLGLRELRHLPGEEVTPLVGSWLACHGLGFTYFALRGESSQDFLLLCAPPQCEGALPTILKAPSPELLGPVGPVFDAELVIRALPRPFDFLNEPEESGWRAVIESESFRQMAGGWVLHILQHELPPDSLPEGRPDPFLELGQRLDMQRICCEHFDSACWGLGDMAEMMDAESLPTAFLDLCFAFLRERSEEEDPDWLVAELARAERVLAGRGAVTREMLAEAEAKAAKSLHPLCRFEVKGNKIKPCELTMQWGHLRSLWRSMSVLHVMRPLPDGLVLLVSSWDAEWEEFPAPVFARCGPRDSSSVLLLPSEFQTAWTYRHFLAEVLETYGGVPFLDRKAQAYWRGSTTDYTIESGKAGSENRSIGQELEEWSRLRLVMLSSLYPERLDAKFTGIGKYVPPALASWIEETGLCCAAHSGPTELRRYRYLVNADATMGVADRLHWYLLTGSAVLQQESNFSIWLLDTAILPGVHFLPVDARWQGLLPALDWAEENQLEVVRMVERAREVGKKAMSVEAVFLYLDRLLRLYASRLDFLEGSGRARDRDAASVAPT